MTTVRTFSHSIFEVLDIDELADQLKTTHWQALPVSCFVERAHCINLLANTILEPLNKKRDQIHLPQVIHSTQQVPALVKNK